MLEGVLESPDECLRIVNAEGAAVLRGALLTARDAAQDALFAPGAEIR